MEIWKDIKDYEGYYQVSNLGNVKSLRRTVSHKQSGTYTFKELILKPNKVKGDYLQVTLNKEGKRKSKYIHVLVMESFEGEKPLGYEVNHKDEDKSNNKYSNLEYLTFKENNNYGNRIKNMKKTAANGKRSKAVLGISLDKTHIIEFPSISEAQRQGYGNHISDVIHKKRNHSKGYTWKFK